MSSNFETTKRILANIAGIDTTLIKPESQIVDLGMDSLEYIALLMDIEAAFGFVFEDDVDLDSLVTVEEFVNFISSHATTLKIPKEDALPPKIYNEEYALTQYVWRYYSTFISHIEKRAVNYYGKLEKIKASARNRGAVGSLAYQRQFDEIAKNLGWVQSDEIENLLRGKEGRFQHIVRERVLTEHGSEIKIYRCPSCNRIPASYKAKQCMWCGHELI